MAEDLKGSSSWHVSWSMRNWCGVKVAPPRGYALYNSIYGYDMDDAYMSRLNNPEEHIFTTVISSVMIIKLQKC